MPRGVWAGSYMGNHRSVTRQREREELGRGLYCGFCGKAEGQA